MPSVERHVQELDDLGDLAVDQLLSSEQNQPLAGRRRARLKATSSMRRAAGP